MLKSYLFRFLPWRFFVGRLAKDYGVPDPFQLLARLHAFAEPAEVKHPIELLRAGMYFHARGLLNTQAIQHNLDWIWPYWVERQFCPHDESFIPRAFSATHVNLTNRNWTAIGIPDYPDYPIVDPRGLLTPFWDGWSIDCWIVAQNEAKLIPSRLSSVSQTLSFQSGLMVSSSFCCDFMKLDLRAHVELDSGSPVCMQEISAQSSEPAELVISVRPYNPEGISPVASIRQKHSSCWSINNQQEIIFSSAPQQSIFACYKEGDVFSFIGSSSKKEKSSFSSCKVGMATGAAIYPLEEDAETSISICVPLGPVTQTPPTGYLSSSEQLWEEALKNAAQMELPNALYSSLYQAALRSVVLHAPKEVFPGPYTYKRFWFRDAVFILNSLLCLGFHQRVEKAISYFVRRQAPTGFFCSQEGEWDANGQVLWLLGRYEELSGKLLGEKLLYALEKGVNWLARKRIPDDGRELHSGLLPAGFSAEHLGPSDYYYWDDFWAAAGLRAAAGVLARHGKKREADFAEKEAQSFLDCIEKSLVQSRSFLSDACIAASPDRRMDAGAIGSVCASYPLLLWEPEDSRILNTVNYLLAKNFVDGAFFQDMTHSGYNAYLSLHLAQILLRAGDMRFAGIVETVAGLASSTGQWPEAIHPRTKGGCMGDGQHIWAAAEWLMMMRSLFIREEKDTLVFLSGIKRSWLTPGAVLSFGPSSTPFGRVHLQAFCKKHHLLVSWKTQWTLPPAKILVCSPDGGSFEASPQSHQLEIPLPESER